MRVCMCVSVSVSVCAYLQICVHACCRVVKRDGKEVKEGMQGRKARKEGFQGEKQGEKPRNE